MRNEKDTPRQPEAPWRYRIAARLGAVTWSGVIFAMSSVPGSSVPGRFGNLAHFIEYSVLALLVSFSVRRKALLDRALIAVAAASAWGVTDEVHQSFVPLRMPDPLDWGIDTLGAIAGAVLAAGLLVALSKRRTQ